jgi:hypothetical protein
MTGWPSIDAALSALGLTFGAPTTGQTTGGSHAPGSEHYQGRARDYGDANSDVKAVATALLPYAQGPNAPIDELFFAPLNIFYKTGQAITPDDALRQGHYNHVHVGIRPGVDLAAAIGGGATATTVGSKIPGAGVVGDLLSPLKNTAFTVVFIVAGLGLVVLGGSRAVKRGQS